MSLMLLRRTGEATAGEREETACNACAEGRSVCECIERDSARGLWPRGGCLPLLVNEHILRFEIAMCHAKRVTRIDRNEHLSKDTAGLRLLQAPMRDDKLKELAPRDVLGDEINVTRLLYDLLREATRAEAARTHSIRVLSQHRARERESQRGAGSKCDGSRVG